MYNTSSVTKLVHSNDISLNPVVLGVVAAIAQYVMWSETADSKQRVNLLGCHSIPQGNDLEALNMMQQACA